MRASRIAARFAVQFWRIDNLHICRDLSKNLRFLHKSVGSVARPFEIPCPFTIFFNILMRSFLHVFRVFEGSLRSLFVVLLSFFRHHRFWPRIDLEFVTHRCVKCISDSWLLAPWSGPWFLAPRKISFGKSCRQIQPNFTNRRITWLQIDTKPPWLPQTTPEPPEPTPQNSRKLTFDFSRID